MGTHCKLGQKVKVARLPGMWSVWSAAPGPSSWWVVPADQIARESGKRYVQVKTRLDGHDKLQVSIQP